VVQQWTLLHVSQKLQENQTAMLIAAALIEGIGFTGYVVCILIRQKTIVATVGCNYFHLLKQKFKLHIMDKLVNQFELISFYKF
jgi:hypothetical protein